MPSAFWKLLADLVESDVFLNSNSLKAYKWSKGFSFFLSSDQVEACQLRVIHQQLYKTPTIVAFKFHCLVGAHISYSL